ncbi:MAG: hypothetical protein IT436_03735 [Phycisphaerales bacterium]|nr:hypothetical protein [Phycisphaerales bacterium]
MSSRCERPDGPWGLVLARALVKRVLLIGVMALSGAASAQPAAPGTKPQPKPVEQGVGDVNPLQVSSRMVPLDLRRPTGWDRVYRLSGDPKRNGGRGLFARFDGGIAAVFPWSTYEPTERGFTPAVPAGTTYYIGDLPDSLTSAGDEGGGGSGEAEVDRSFNFVDRSARPGQPERPRMHAETGIETSAREGIRRGAVVDPAVDPGVTAGSGPTIWTSESYRRERLEALLGAAAR